MSGATHSALPKGVIHTRLTRLIFDIIDRARPFLASAQNRDGPKLSVPTHLHLPSIVFFLVCFSLLITISVLLHRTRFGVPWGDKRNPLIAQNYGGSQNPLRAYLVESFQVIDLGMRPVVGSQPSNMKARIYEPTEESPDLMDPGRALYDHISLGIVDTIVMGDAGVCAVERDPLHLGVIILRSSTQSSLQYPIDSIVAPTWGATLDSTSRKKLIFAFKTVS